MPKTVMKNLQVIKSHGNGELLGDDNDYDESKHYGDNDDETIPSINGIEIDNSLSITLTDQILIQWQEHRAKLPLWLIPW